MFLLLCTAMGIDLSAQERQISGFGGRLGGAMPGMGGGGGRFRSGVTGGGGDSLQRRDKQADSITISFRYLDSPAALRLDSSVDEIDRRFPLRSDWVHLGNLGTAARPLAFTPRLQAGFDPGFHALDAYAWSPERARYFQTTRPYSELNYLLGSRAEQVIELMHTQNIRPQWNFMGGYRLINAPGFFQNQLSNHHNYVFTTRYQSKNLRYTQYLSLTSNKLQVGENGGIFDTAGVLDNPVYKERFNLPTRIGGSNTFSANFFNTQIRTGNFYKTTQFLSRHQYDFGKKDSLVTDSTVIPLFFPRFRLEGTLRYDRMRYEFLDQRGDSTYYNAAYAWNWQQLYDTVQLQDQWKALSFEFALYQFPDPRNLHQFVRLAVNAQSIKGRTDFASPDFVNTSIQGEYRNLTRNKRWDLFAFGQLFLSGFNQGDYRARASLLRNVSNVGPTLRLGFEQVNRQPGFVFDARSSFNRSSLPITFRKENVTRLEGEIRWNRIGLQLEGSYYLVGRLAYWSDFMTPAQADALFNMLQVRAAKTWRLGKSWRWHAELLWQQRIGTAPVNAIPFFTRHRVAYEGNLGFKNLQLATGLEVRYRPPYKADEYSPVLGQFFYQDQRTIRNSLPDIAAYAHFRIRPFTAFVRAENLNTARDMEGFGFTRNNAVSPGYYLPGLQIRLGVFWRFVN